MITSISIPKDKVHLYNRLQLKMKVMGIKSISALFVEFIEELVDTEKEIGLITTDVMIRYMKKEMAALDGQIAISQKQKQALIKEMKELEDKREIILQRHETSETEKKIMEQLIEKEMEIIQQEYHGHIPEKTARLKAEARVRDRMKQKS